MNVVSDEDSDSGDEDVWDDGEDETETWSSLDTRLSRLAKQVPKVEGRMTLRLKFQHSGSEPPKFDHLLSQFLEYGELDVHSTPVSIGCLGVSLHSSLLFATNLSTRLHHDSAIELFGKIAVGRPGVSSRIRTLSHSELDECSCVVGRFLARTALRKAVVHCNNLRPRDIRRDFYPCGRRTPKKKTKRQEQTASFEFMKSIV